MQWRARWAVGVSVLAMEDGRRAHEARRAFVKDGAAIGQQQEEVEERHADGPHDDEEPRARVDGRVTCVAPHALDARVGAEEFADVHADELGARLGGLVLVLRARPRLEEAGGDRGAEAEEDEEHQRQRLEEAAEEGGAEAVLAAEDGAHEAKRQGGGHDGERDEATEHDARLEAAGKARAWEGEGR